MALKFIIHGAICVFVLSLFGIYYIQIHYELRIVRKGSQNHPTTKSGSIEYEFMNIDKLPCPEEKKKTGKATRISNSVFISNGTSSIDKSLDFTLPKKIPVGNLTYKTLMQMDTPNFLKDYSAPCLKIDEAETGSVISGLKVNCLPVAYLAGQPKCGSSDLYDFLARHPDIIRTKKEPQYWSRGRFLEGKEEMKTYFNIYGNASLEIQQECGIKKNNCRRKKVFIDGSVSLLWDNTNWPLMPGNVHQRAPQILNAHHIRHLTPNAKIIVILRNPVDREYSSYLYFSKGIAVSAIDFHQKVHWSIEAFNNCSKLMGSRTCAYNKTIQRTLPIRLYIGLYSIFISDWLKIFPRNQFYFIRLEDYKENRIKYVQQILKFIGVEQPPYWFYKLNDKPVANQRRPATKSIEEMLPETRKLLKDFFGPFNKKLAKILNNKNYSYE